MASNFKKFISDSELLQAEFRIRNPLLTVEGLTATKPDSEIAVSIVGFYDETPFGGRTSNPEEPYIWCCHCQKDTHWIGYVVEDSTSTRFTIGNKCGLDHYGASFGASEKHFNEKRARQGVLRAFLRLNSKIDGLEAEIENVLRCRGLIAHERKRDELQQAAPKGFKTLRRAVEQGSLTAVKKTRNFEAEEERLSRYKRAIEHFHSLPAEERIQLRDDGLKPELDDDPIIDSRLVDFGHALGTSLLGFSDPRMDALKVRKPLSTLRKIQNTGTDKFSSKEIAFSRKALFETTKSLRNSLISIAFAQTFFETQNLNRLAQWSDCFRGFSFRLDNGQFLVSDDGHPYKCIRSETFENVVETPVLEQIHYTDIEDELLATGDAIFRDPDDPTSEVLV